MLGLVNAYKKVATFFLGLATLAAVFTVSVFLPSIRPMLPEDKLLQDVVGFFVSIGGVYGVIYAVPMFLYEKWAWRWHKPKFDYSGYWHLTIEYQYMEKPPPPNIEALELPHKIKSVFTVEQTPFTFKITEGFSASIESWYSTSVGLSDSGVLTISYEGTRQLPKIGKKYGDRSKGVIDMKVIENSRIMGKPTVMRGEFHHCCLPDIPLYRGVNIYRRINRKQRKMLIEQFKLYGMSSPDDEKTEQSR